MNITITKNLKRLSLRRWIHLAFLVWAIFAMWWLIDSIRTRGVDDKFLQSSPNVLVASEAISLNFLPVHGLGSKALIFFCGSGIAAQAYAPLLRPIADKGFPVFVINLPYRFAPLESHKVAALARAREVIAAHPEVKQWVIAGHSLGAALAARMVSQDKNLFAAMVLVATTHPKDDDLSLLKIPVTKIVALNDGVAPPDRVRANRHLLPSHTKWVQIAGGNHSQFGRYGQQLFDGDATISRETQEALTRSAILEVMGQLE